MILEGEGIEQSYWDLVCSVDMVDPPQFRITREGDDPAEMVTAAWTGPSVFSGGTYKRQAVLLLAGPIAVDPDPSAYQLTRYGNYSIKCYVRSPDGVLLLVRPTTGRLTVED